MSLKHMAAFLITWWKPFQDSICFSCEGMRDSTELLELKESIFHWKNESIFFKVANTYIEFNKSVKHLLLLLLLYRTSEVFQVGPPWRSAILVSEGPRAEEVLMGRRRWCFFCIYCCFSLYLSLYSYSAWFLRMIFSFTLMRLLLHIVLHIFGVGRNSTHFHILRPSVRLPSLLV